MSGPIVTVSHRRDVVEDWQMCAAEPLRVGVDIRAEVTYRPDQAMEALQAVAAMAADLGRQIADAAERNAES